MIEAEVPPVPPRLRPYLDEIAERLYSGHAAVMVGAGFSRNAKPKGDSGPSFPDWSELGDRFYEKLNGKKPGSDSRYLNVLKLADEVEAVFGRPTLNQILYDAIPDLAYEPSQLHVDLLDLPWSDVFTTNYDTLLERACKSVASQIYNVVVKKEDLVYSEKPRIVKLHGSFPSDQPFIITEDDYRRYPDDFSPFVNTVRQALLENTLCLIGFSGDDPNFLQWIGWIRDNLGQKNSPKIYLVDPLGLSESKKKFLEQRNIDLVDISEYHDIGGDYYKTLEFFLHYLKKQKDERLKRPEWIEWLYDNEVDLLEPMGKREQLLKLLQTWKTQRHSYPGWVVVPEDNRSQLWLYTKKWLSYISDRDDLPNFVDLEFAFELNWRMEKCLCPIHGDQFTSFESILNRYMPFMDLNTPVESLTATIEEMKERGLNRHDVRNMCHCLLISMMRFCREAGLLEKWKDFCGKIQDDAQNLSPEHKEHFHYELVLFELSRLNLQELKKRIAEWQVNESLPFWAAKKASLLAEIGQVNEAIQILENSLAAIRAKINLKPITTDYSLVSQESFIMFLLRCAQLPLAFSADGWSKFEELRNKLSKRWHTLSQYKCDPWRELKIFRSALDRPPVEKLGIKEKIEFDIGRITRIHDFGDSHYEDVLTAYKFLRFCEDTGIPFRTPELAIKETAAGALPRVAGYSLYWMIAYLVRIGDEKVVDRIFDRASLYRMETASIDSLIEHYLNILESAIEDIRSGDPIGHSNFGIVLAKVIPEILSRLCCKCSTDTKRKLICFLLGVYQSDYKQNYGGIQNLTKRTLDAFSVSQRFDLIPKLLDFPILSDSSGIRHEFKNPFQFLDMKWDLMIDKPDISDEKIGVLFEKASSDNTEVRKWVMWTLFRLHSWNLLKSRHINQFTETLWDKLKLDDYGLPSQTDFYRLTFLDLPHPEEVDPVSSFKKYIHHEWSLIQGGRTESTVHIDENRLCIETINANIEWSSEDVNFIFDRLIEWWNKDKLYLTMEDTPSLFHVSIAEEFRDRLKYLVDVFETVILPNFHLIEDENKEETLRHLVDEFRDRNLPALRMEAACLDIFPEWKEDVLGRIEDGMIDTNHGVVIESLRSIWNLVKRTKSKTDDKDLTRVLNMLGEMVRWQKSRDLASTLDIIIGLLKEFDWTFSDELERSTLVALRRIASTSMDAEVLDFSEKLEIRHRAACLAYELFEHYTKRGDSIPDEIKEWKTICQSENEFAEVRNQWIRQDPE